ncbi:hypothetical protein GCM10007049_07360 [Echinicola pacifica]|uniref:Phosphoribosylanthranilate isomerase n=1 Tax=Echinicola pacifica TaxID=346377 RepID=A0A918PQ87_9BACT|nr:phosphoribosylanthranilate isomerase [Echinicola pacifica]GGZ17394.1 hypothetical protein GCM10007049_07360 [Echinicola pacifica]
MALKTFVKVSSVNNLSDARYCAGMYVSLLGFSLEEYDKNYISPETYKEITGWLSGLEYVAEFETSHPDNILEKVKAYEGIDHIQISEEAHLRMLANTSYNLLFKKELNALGELEHLKAIAPSLAENNITLVLESGNLELAEDAIGLIKELSGQCQVLLGFGLEPENLEAILEKTGAQGLALKGGDEIKPGYKDFDELADILEALEED